MDEISKSTKEKLEKDGINLKFAAEASVVGLGSASSSREFGITNEEKEKYEKSVESSTVVTTGSKLPEDGKVRIIIFFKFTRKCRNNCLFACLFYFFCLSELGSRQLSS